ncbi:SIP domain-containing protein [Kitasatospora sp. NPDC048540]|uniref:SIP domain-containing protein n=1 Tax=Kitasatospora sp. NPDC048540 TaxID=3155634 RepID=UPI0033FAF3BC
MGYGWEGVVLGLLRGKDFTFTVTGAARLTEHVRRIDFTDGGMLAATSLHPTMWTFAWIACDTATTRALAQLFCKQAGLPKDRVHVLGYWRP